jgi:hypothetical protein
MGDDEISQGETSQETAQSSIFNLLGDYWAAKLLCLVHNFTTSVSWTHVTWQKTLINAKL